MLLVLLMSGAIAVGLRLLPWPDDEVDVRPEPKQPTSWHDQLMTDLPAGTYYLDLATGGGAAGSAAIRVTFTLPAGWERVQVEGLLWGQSLWVGLAVPVNLYVDACAPEPVMRDPPVGPSAADLAAALNEVRGWTVHDVTDVVVDGYPGKRVMMTAPGAESDCADGLLLRKIAWPGFTQAMRASEPVTLWILDVEDERLVIWSGRQPDSSVGKIRELTRVVDSIKIAYLAAVPPGTDRGADP
jgi:hypothetical protein